MASKVNVIGREYLASFESVCGLIRSGCLEGSDLALSLGREGNETAIVDEKTHDVFLCTARRSREDSAAAAASLEKKGASWFASLRGEKTEFPNAAWLLLIDKVSAAYHRRYSLLEFKKKKLDRSETDRLAADAAKVARRVKETFCPEIGGECSVALREGGGDDIYGVSLRLGLSGGTGEAQPVLCKVYFRRTGDRLTALASAAADRIETYISEEVLRAGDDEGFAMSESSAKENETVIRTALNALSDLIYPAEGESRFSESVCFPKRRAGGGTDDEAIVRGLAAKMLNAKKTIECKSVKVLGISHVKWENTAFDVAAGGRKLFRVEFEPSGRFGLSCLACSDEPLVESGRIYLADEEGNGQWLDLDPDAEDFGLNAEQKARAAEQIFGKHLRPIVCGVRGGECSNYLCASRALAFGEDGWRCKTCPYPEIVFFRADGTPLLTEKTVYAADRKSLVPAEESVKCACCGRDFSDGGTDENGLCAFCAAALGGTDPETADEAARKYKRYAGMLPLVLRMRAAGRRKYCYDDGSVLLFVLGREKYLFTKTEIRESGYLPSPKRLKGV